MFIVFYLGMWHAVISIALLLAIVPHFMFSFPNSDPSSDPISDPGSNPSSNPGSSPGSDPGFIISLSQFLVAFLVFSASLPSVISVFLPLII